MEIDVLQMQKSRYEYIVTTQSYCMGQKQYENTPRWN